MNVIDWVTEQLERLIRWLDGLGEEDREVYYAWRDTYVDGLADEKQEEQ